MQIVIVGRPNVGKSTLFNRLVGTRRAIIDSEPGITRDPVSETIVIAGQNCSLSDTAGLGESAAEWAKHSAHRAFAGHALEQSSSELNALIAHTSWESIAVADIILLMLDVLNITPEDEQLIEYLRPQSDRLILLVNKVDNERRSHMVYEFYKFGINPVLSLSAVQGLGVEDLLQELELRVSDRVGAASNSADVSPASPQHEKQGEVRNIAYIDPETSNEPDREPQKHPPDPAHSEAQHTPPPLAKILILGQPNTGKSTLANYLSDSEKSIVSSIPGTTRDLLYRHFTRSGQAFQLIDSAGIRRKAKVHSNVEYYSVNRAIGAIGTAEVILLLIDGAKGLSEQDKKIAAQTVKQGRGIILVLNKWDLIEKKPNTLEAMQDRVRFLFPILHFAPILPLSAQTGEGVDELLRTALRLRAQLYTRIGTGRLNRALQGWKAQNPPPRKKSLAFKLKYLVHVSTLPSKFILFVNRKKGLPDSYIGYIKNQIRSQFGIEEIPIQLEIRESQ